MTRYYSRAYLLTKVLTANNREVILYLYEGALGFLNRAIQARKVANEAAAGEAVERVVSILIELSAGLDYTKNGSLALRLDGIYNYLIDALTMSSRTGNLEALESCEGVLKILSDAWHQAVSSEAGVAIEEPAAQLRLTA